MLKIIGITCNILDHNVKKDINYINKIGRSLNISKLNHTLKLCIGQRGSLKEMLKLKLHGIG